MGIPQLEKRDGVSDEANQAREPGCAPEGGDRGGQVVAVGTPEDVAKVKGSFTGKFLKEIL